MVVLEHPPNVKTRYQYKLLATTFTSTLQKEVTQAQAEGYVLIGMVSRDEHMVIMEKTKVKDLTDEEIAPIKGIIGETPVPRKSAPKLNK